jgi:very-short-patch-repair endonuclease
MRDEVATRDPERDVWREMHGPDQVIVALADWQHGVVTTRQLALAGLTRSVISRRVGRGWLTPVFRGVYLVGPVADPLAREMAAILTCSQTAALSHHSAAAVWGFRHHTGDIHVSVTTGHPRHRPGLRIHRTHSLNAAVLHGLPLTTPARTLHDLAAHLPQHELDRAVEEAQVLRLVTREELEQLTGRPKLRRALTTEPAMTRSEGERRLVRLIRAARLPHPVTNTHVAGHEADALWPERRLIAEVDGWAYHGSREAFERDRRRDAALQAAGYRVVRFTWRQLADEPHAVVARLAQLLTHV